MLESPLIPIGSFQMPILFLFVFVSFVIFIFTFWQEGKKEGFDQEKLLDIVFLTLGLFIFSFKFEPVIIFSLVIIAAYILPRLWKWSVFRISDIFMLSVFVGSVPILVGIGLMTGNWVVYSYILLNFLLFWYFNRIRNYRLKSGVVYSILLLIIIVEASLFFRSQIQLIFYVFLIIMSLLNLVFRMRVSMSNILSNEFLNEIKGKLLKKEKQLKTEQKLLIQEDPYRDTSRVRDNSESIDEAILEDQSKANNTVNQNAIKQLLSQVRKALNRFKVGKYGVCEVCGKPIDKARLEFYPEATTCLEHAPDNVE